MKAFFVVCACLFLSYFSSAGTISVTADTSPPDPNEEITVWVCTDEPLLFMELGVYVNGDATITSAMSEADCNEFGWENGWGFDPIIDDQNGWVCLNGLCWAADANDIVGYFKFRYHSGQVAVYIDQENSKAGNWGNNFTFSDEPITVGTLELPPLIEQEEPEPVLLDSPTNTSGSPRGEMDSFAGWSQQGAMLEMLDSEPIVYVIDSDITTNQVWDANNVYYITAVNGVDVQALLVIEPGTTVIFGYQCGLFVNNGGTLIAKGTPNEPIICTPDYMYFSYPDYIGYYWQALASYGPYYYCPIYIQETASPATTVRYCMIEGAVGGIVTDNIRLNDPIENNYLFGNIYGIYELGPKLTDVRNNLCFYQEQAAIEIELCPDPNGFADLDHAAKIEHNTCDGSGYTYCGITVHGVADPNSSGIPTIYLTNNIVTINYNYGLNLVDGAMYALVISTGYFDNYYNKNWEFDEYNPVVAQSNPYYPYIGEKPYWRHHLAEGSDFIDAGLQYIEQTKLIGTTTNAESVPDEDLVDLGFHHTDWDYVGGGGIAGTDIDNLITLSNYWLTYTPYDPNSPNYQDPNIVDPNTISYGGDWNDDGFVDMADFAIMAQTWNAAPVEPNIIPVISGDPSNGWVEISAGGYNPDAQSVFAVVNGKYVGRVYGFGNDTPIAVDVSESGNRPQQLKLITIDCDGHITCSGLTDITYTSPLSYCILPQSYEPNEPIPFAAYNTEPNTVSTVSVYADGGQVVWLQSFVGNTINGSIPASVATDHRISFVSFEPPVGTSVTKVIVKDPHPFMAPNPDITGMIVIGSLQILLNETRTINAVEQAFVDRGIKYVILVWPFDTWAAIAKYAPQLKYLYISGHGGWAMTLGKDGVLRTFIELSDGPCVSAKASDFAGTPPLWCADPLPGYLENSFAKSFASMGFTKLRFFYNDSCMGGHLSIGSHGNLVEGRAGQQGLLDPTTHNDMSVACGMTGSTEDRFYQGWFDESESLWWPQEETSYQKFSRLEWESLGEGNNLEEAMMDAISYVIMQGGEDDAIDDYRIKGQTYLWEVRLSSN